MINRPEKSVLIFLLIPVHKVHILGIHFPISMYFKWSLSSLVSYTPV